MLKEQSSQSKKKNFKEELSIENQGIKIDRRFMSSLEELILLLMKKEENFDEIKTEQTTKIRLKKIQKCYLKEDRVKMHEMIEKF